MMAALLVDCLDRGGKESVGFDSGCITGIVSRALGIMCSLWIYKSLSCCTYLSLNINLQWITGMICFESWQCYDLG